MYQKVIILSNRRTVVLDLTPWGWWKFTSNSQ